MDEWANAWTRYYTGGKGNYMIAGMEDSGTMQALTFLSQAGRVDLQRVLVLRTVSNYDREAPGTTAADSLKAMASGNYSAYMPALEAAQTVGDKVVRDIVEHWADRESNIPHAPLECAAGSQATTSPKLRPTPALRGRCLREMRTHRDDGCIRCGRG